MARGYKLRHGAAKPPWRGYPKSRKHTPVFGEKNGRRFYVTSTKNRDGLDAVIAKQDMIPHMARIERRIGRMVLTELITGKNLWELSIPDRPPIQVVENALSSFIDALEKSSIVHADLRPWNVLYVPENHRIAVIDWGHCYQLHGEAPPCSKHLKASGHAPPYDNIDRCDLKRLVKALQEPRISQELWKMKSSPTWFPDKWLD